MNQTIFLSVEYDASKNWRSLLDVTVPYYRGEAQDTLIHFSLWRGYPSMPQTTGPQFVLIWWALESLLGLFPTVWSMCPNKASNILATFCSHDPINVMSSIKWAKVIFCKVSRELVPFGLHFDSE